MNWDFRVVRDGELDDDCCYDIRKVYYTKRGKIRMWGSSSYSPLGDSLEDLKEEILMMLDAFDKPILEEYGKVKLREVKE